MPISAVPMLFAEGPCARPSEVDGDWLQFQESSSFNEEPSIPVFLFSQTVCQLVTVWRNPGTSPVDNT